MFTLNYNRSIIEKFFFASFFINEPAETTHSLFARAIIEELLIEQIAKNFVYENGVWLKNFGDYYFEKDYLNHPKENESVNLCEWGKRLIGKINCDVNCDSD